MQPIDIEKEKKEILNKYKSLLRACADKTDKKDKKEIRKAFNLAVNRAILGGASLRKDFFTPSDLILPAASISEDADKLSEQSLMKVFVDSIPDSSTSLSSLKVGDKSTDVKEGIDDLKKLAKLAQTEANKGILNKWNLYEAWGKIWRR